ncbi:MAG TPA: hypothetical protein VI542_28310, partial [Candidatus Tectomicrobia bacterium]
MLTTTSASTARVRRGAGAAARAACAAFGVPFLSVALAASAPPMEEFHSNSGNFWQRYRANPKYASCRGLVDQHEQMTMQLHALDQQAKRAVAPRQGQIVKDLNRLAAQRSDVQRELFACVRLASQAPANPSFNDTYGSNGRPGSGPRQPQPGNERFDSSGGDRTSRDGSTRPPPPPSRVTPPAQQARAITRQYRLTVKSFIAHIGDNIGPTPRQPGNLVHADMNFRALAAAVDAGFNENPRDENQDKGYRLYSHLGVLVTCTGSRLTRYDIGQVFSDVGTEPARPIGRVVATTPPPMTITVHPTRPSAHGVEFGWFGKGRPPDVIEAAMTVGVAGRNGRDIWHDVTARIVCTGDGPQIHAQLEASHFPSHRL